MLIPGFKPLNSLTLYVPTRTIQVSEPSKPTLRNILPIIIDLKTDTKTFEPYNPRYKCLKSELKPVYPHLLCTNLYNNWIRGLILELLGLCKDGCSVLKNCFKTLRGAELPSVEYPRYYILFGELRRLLPTITVYNV